MNISRIGTQCNQKSSLDCPESRTYTEKNHDYKISGFGDYNTKGRAIYI